MIANSANAQAPAYAYTPSSTSVDTIPLGNSSLNGAQFLFTPSDFSPAVPSSGGIISRIYIKAGNAQAAGSIMNNLLFNIGQSALTTLSNSWISGQTTVYSAVTTAIPAWTANGWVAFNLSTPFTWNGTSNLIIGLTQSGYSNPLPLVQGTVSGRNSRVYGNGNNGSPNSADNRLISLGFDLGCNGTPSIPGISTAAITTANPVCQGTSITLTGTYPASPVVSGISYQWQSSASASGPWTNVTGGTGATSLSYTTAFLTSDTYFRIGATCGNSGITSYSNPFFVPVGSPQPGAITGPATFCPGDPVTYSVANVSGINYDWILPSGWSGSSTTHSITVTPGATPGIISVAANASSSCGSSVARTYTPVMGSAPGTPGTIFGNNYICPGTTQTYSTVAINGALSYIWTLPSGWSGTSVTNSITVSNITTSGQITVRAVNGCGQSSNAAPLMVHVTGSLANPGPITGKDTVCSGSLQSYSISPVPGATFYTWTLPGGWSGTTTGTSIQAFAGSNSGTISVQASSSCAASPASFRMLTVINTVTPAVSLTGPASALCEGTPATFTATPVNGGSFPVYQWKKNGLNIAHTGSTYTDNALAGGDFISVEMTSNASCTTGPVALSGPVSASILPTVVPGISIQSTPPVTICKGTPVTFTTTASGTGSAPAYQWYKNGSPISGANSNTYTDALLNHADTISVTMATNAACASMPVAPSNKVGVSVSDYLTPSVSVGVSPSEYILPGTPLTFLATHSNGGATPDFQWLKNGAIIPFETGDSYSTNSLKPGDHISVRMLSYAQCVASPLVFSNTIVLKAPLSVVGAAQSTAALRLYPNPNNGRFSISAASWALTGADIHLDVVNMAGQTAYSLTFSPAVQNNSWRADVGLPAGLANGQYMLHISTADGTIRTALPLILNR